MTLLVGANTDEAKHTQKFETVELPLIVLAKLKNYICHIHTIKI
jgi:hypothetical protein